MSKILMSF